MNRAIKIISALLVLNIFIWGFIILREKSFAGYFFSVGQGDSEMIVLPGNKEARILIDGGPNFKIISELEKVLPFFSRRIDLVLASHTDGDHIGGLSEVFNRYQVGAFVFNGEEGGESFENLSKILKEKNIPIIILKEKDKIKYGENFFKVLNSKEGVREKNENSLVLLLEAENKKILFTGDISQKIEEAILEKEKIGEIDILKVAHHGSKYSSGENFISNINPKISIIEVGKNSYGHPTYETLNRLESVKSLIFRTDERGTIKVEADKEGKIKVYSLK